MTLGFRGSDYKPISIIFSNSNLKFDKAYKRIGVNKVLWGKFTENMLENFDFNKEINLNNFEVEYEEFVKVIYKSLEEAGGQFPNGVNGGGNRDTYK